MSGGRLDSIQGCRSWATRLVSLLSAHFLLLPDAVHASTPPEGAPTYWFSVGVIRVPGSDSELRAILDVGALEGLYSPGTTAVVRLSFPPASVRATSDEVFRIPLRSDRRPLSISFRRPGPGRHVIRAVLDVEDARAKIREDAEIEVPVTAEADSIVIHPATLVRQVHWVGGRRYRFGGSFLVPIEEGESVTQDQLLTEGRRSRIRARAKAACRDCGPGATRAVLWVVCTGPRGNITEMRPIGADQADSLAVLATRAALQKGQFAPAQWRGRPVSDCLVVTVPIE